MPDSTRQMPFKVDIAGIIEIMGSSLYSRADTPIRELLQNAHDAIMRRRRKDLDYLGRIDIEQEADAGLLRFTDDGVGLSQHDAETYLSTLGIGVTGLIKRGHLPGRSSAVSAHADGEPGAGENSTENANDLPPATRSGAGSGDLIGQFGIGLFSAFLLAERLVVESRRTDLPEGVRWEASPGAAITISSCVREKPGTTVTLHLKPEHRLFAQQETVLEAAVKEYADFLPVPIYLNRRDQRTNVIHVSWFDPTPDPETIALDLEAYFQESPLDIIPVRLEQPVSLAGALYVTPQRTPGFSGDPVVTVTVRNMVISRHIQGLLPNWASFLRGVLELNDCAPTASREDLVRDQRFQHARNCLAEVLYEHFEEMLSREPKRFESVLTWHRYTLAGAALSDPRLRALLRSSYRLPTSRGLLSFEEIFEQSTADPLFENDADRVVWYNIDRRQERWVNDLFAPHEMPCVHTLRSFEESLLAAMVADDNAVGITTDLRIASPSAANFASSVLNIRDLEEAPPRWQQFLDVTEAKVLCGSFRAEQPIMAFLNERYELSRTFEDLKKDGNIPAGFQRLIDSHFAETPDQRNEVVLNRNHRLVARAMEQNTGSPLASVLRLLVLNALNSAGASTGRSAQQQQVEDLDWIADALWGRDPQPPNQ